MKNLVLAMTILWLGLPLVAPGQEDRSKTPETDDDIVKFDLNFEGGNPHELIKALEKVGVHVNAIIADQDHEVGLPSLKVKGVTVTDLFRALEFATRKEEVVVSGYSENQGARRPNYRSHHTMAAFVRQGNVWVFRHEKAPEIPGPVARSKFYHLGPYLNTYTIEDITTAIQTAWEMMGFNKDSTKKTLKFHKETSLLIAVANEDLLQVVEQVLDTLGRSLGSKTKGGGSGSAYPSEPTTNKAPAPSKAPGQ